MSVRFASVWFDCDSTLCAIEGIEELADRHRPHLAAEIRALTNAAMDGTVPVESVYARRLALVAPTRAEIEAIGARYVATVLPGAADVVRTLQALGKTVGIVSGGLRPPVQALAAHLGIRVEHVHAVPVAFDQDGRYAGVPEGHPLTRAGGKREVMAALPAALRPAAFVGDGVTDLDTKGTVARFVGFGGVVTRARVQAEADVFVPGPDLRAVLGALLDADELRASR